MMFFNIILDFFAAIMLDEMIEIAFRDGHFGNKLLPGITPNSPTACIVFDRE